MNGPGSGYPPPLLRISPTSTTPTGGAGRNREDRGFWMELGVDGFRIDAVPFLLEDGGQDVGLDPHELLGASVFHLARNGGAVLLSEVNLPPDR